MSDEWQSRHNQCDLGHTNNCPNMQKILQPSVCIPNRTLEIFKESNSIDMAACNNPWIHTNLSRISHSAKTILRL